MAPRLRANGFTVVAGLVLGYIGIYLCRKNYAVALPILAREPGVTKENLGWVASVSTAAYAAGKLLLGPLVDRVGGRAGFLASMVAVAAFGAVSALAPGLVVLTIAYSLNRFAGAGGWPSMMKLVPTWFRAERTGFVVAVLSLAYVFGGACATVLAGQVVERGGGWRAVMAFPSLVLLLIAGLCALLVRPGPLLPSAAKTSEKVVGAVGLLLRRRQFLLVCALSFTLTLMRDTFNTWSVDFLTTVQVAHSVKAAALSSTMFDIAGAASILLMGLVWDRVHPGFRRWLIAVILAALTVLLAILPSVSESAPGAASWLLAAVGLLVYGPYSLLAGAMAIESGGARLAASASGIIDAIGYAGSALSGVVFGRLLDAGGYSLGFRCLAVATAVAAVLSLGLAGKRPAEVEQET